MKAPYSKYKKLEPYVVDDSQRTGLSRRRRQHIEKTCQEDGFSNCFPQDK